MPVPHPSPPMLIGAHVSPAGGPAKAVERGEERGARSDPDLQPEPAGVEADASTPTRRSPAFREALDGRARSTRC